MSNEPTPRDAEQRLRRLEAAMFDVQREISRTPVSGDNGAAARPIGLKLTDLDDVGRYPAEGQFLRYRHDSGLWVPETYP